MANFIITPTTTVAELKAQFSSEIGGVLRIYEGRSEAADGATLVSLGAKEGELECRTSRTVGKFEEAFLNDLNLKVKVYTKDNWVKVLDGITLATAAELPNGMTKEKMEEYLSYQRDENEDEEDKQSKTDLQSLITHKTDVTMLPNPNAIYFVIDSEPRAVEDYDNDEDSYEEGFIAYRAIVNADYVYGVWRYPIEDLANELNIDIEDIEVYDMGYGYNSVTNYPSEENIYLPEWLYGLYTSPDSNLAELCPDEDSEPIKAAINCCLTDKTPDWTLDKEVPCILIDSEGNSLKKWFAAR